MIKNNIKSILKIEEKLSKVQKRKLLLILIASPFVAALESLSIITALPVFNIVIKSGETSTDSITSNDINIIDGLMNIIEYAIPEKNIVLAIVSCFAALLLATYFARLNLFKAQNNLSYNISHELSVKVYNNILNQKLDYHIINHDSKLLAVILNKSTGIGTLVVFPLMSALTSFMLLIGIFVAMLMVSQEATYIIIVVTVIIYVTLGAYYSNDLRKGSEIVNQCINSSLREVQEGLGSIRDIIIGDYQNHYAMKYEKIDKVLKDTQSSLQVIGVRPRYIVELIAYILLLVVVLYFSHNADTGTIASSVLVLGFAALKAIPAANQLYTSWNNLKVGVPLVEEVLGFLNLQTDVNDHSSGEIQFREKIELQNVTYHRPDGSLILNNINLTVNKGQSVAIIGESGSGKSTLLDLLMGLLTPSSGAILIDGQEVNNTNVKSWMSKIGHVAQNISLEDDTLTSNIALADIEPNKIKLLQAAKTACVSDLLLNDKQGMTLGQGGGKLSGGQRQRVLIARALYKTDEILCLDEATSALDKFTEKAVLHNIKQNYKGLTIMSITHKTDTIKEYDMIISVENGCVTTSHNEQ